MLGKSLKNIAFEAAGQDGETYQTWRQRTELEIAALSINTSQTRGDVMPVIWETQRVIAEKTLSGEPIGPFADFFYAIHPNDRVVEIMPSEDTGKYLPAGESHIVETNSKILTLSQNIEEPIEFLTTSLKTISKRKHMVGIQSIGPENYTTSLKFFADKTDHMPLDPKKDGPTIKKLVGQTLAGFLKAAEKDKPNIIEIINTLVSIKVLPAHSVDKGLTEGILKHTVALINDFDARGSHNLIAAMTKMDFSECADGAAMTLDLALRRGYGFERSSDLLIALHAVSNLPPGRMSERAFHTLLEVRTSLEISADPSELKEINKRLLFIVRHVTKNPKDSMAAKDLAKTIAKRIADITKAEAANRELTDSDTQTAQEIVNTYRQI